VLNNGVAYGEPYESAAADLKVEGKSIEASNVALKLHGMQIVGNGGYDLTSDRLHGHIQGNNLQLSKFKTVQDKNLNADGSLSILADADGTLTEPELKATVKLADVKFNGQAVGEVAANLHSEGKTLIYTANSTVVGAKVDASGQTLLTGNFDTTAKLNFAGLDIK
jgi:translocation and assembly module TamB